LQRSLLFAQISDDRASLTLIEKLLVQLLGYSDISVRDQAIIFLNMLYDGVDWQLQSAFRPVVRVVGQHFKVNIIVDHDLEKSKDAQIFIGLSAPSPIENVNQTVLTWHKIDQRNIVKAKDYETEISINFGKFWKCGFYDWRIIIVKETGKMAPL
jgi:starch synthase